MTAPANPEHVERSLIVRVMGVELLLGLTFLAPFRAD
jgi:hypothetical protein